LKDTSGESEAKDQNTASFELDVKLLQRQGGVFEYLENKGEQRGIHKGVTKGGPQPIFEYPLYNCEEKLLNSTTTVHRSLFHSDDNG